jgi:hypothetical protein
VPVKRFLDNGPTTWHFEKREQIGHAGVRTGQLTGPAGNLKTNHRDGTEDVDTNHTGLNLGSGTILGRKQTR